ncbi:TPA: hypothetical protein ACNV1G_004553 [Citrobacter amalonaticus]
MKFSDIVIFSVIIVGGYTYFSKTTAPTANEKLISQFDKHNIVKQNEWTKGNVIDGIQVYTAKKDYTIIYSVWLLGKNEAAVTVLADGKMPESQGVFIISQCNQLVMAVTNRKVTDVKDEVLSILEKAGGADKDKDGVLRASGEIAGKLFRVSIREIDSIPAFTCAIKTA